MKSILYSKKGDIPVTILVIEVLAVCLFALFSFVASGENSSQKFYGISAMYEMNVKIEDYFFYKNQGFSEEKINSIIEVKAEEDSGRPYIKIEKYLNSPFYKSLFSNSEKKIFFSVKYYLPQR